MIKFIGENCPCKYNDIGNSSDNPINIAYHKMYIPHHHEEKIPKINDLDYNTYVNKNPYIEFAFLGVTPMY